MTRKSVFQTLKERQEARERGDAESELPSSLLKDVDDSAAGTAPPAAPAPERPPRRRRRVSVLVSLGAIAPLPANPLTSQQGDEHDA